MFDTKFHHVCRNGIQTSSNVHFVTLKRKLLNSDPQVVKTESNQVYRHGIVLKCRWLVEQMPEESPLISEKFEFRNEKVFSASLVYKNCYEKQNNTSSLILVFKSSNHHKIGLQIYKVLLTLTCPGMAESDPTEMICMPHLENELLREFNLSTPQLPFPVTITYYIYVNETITNYRYELVDLLCMAHLWIAARRRQFTDFEFLVKGKVFPAHRAVLAARSPVLANLLSQSETEYLRIEDMDVPIFEHFLHFIYTGRLTTSAANAQLLVAAERFQIVTLKNLCQNAAQESDADSSRIS